MTGSISHAVGINGLNRDPDVRIIQSLLNNALGRYPKFAASGVTKLVVDGDAGPLTKKAVVKFQETVMGWSGRSVDGTVSPGRQTWKALNGNVDSPSAIKPQPTPASMWIGGYSAFRQGDYKEKLGDSTSATIAGYGCALCTLTMAATSIGAPTEHWPSDLQPKDLTPSKANVILRKAGAFNGYAMTISLGADALGMTYDEYGRNSNLSDEHLTLLDSHLGAGLPVAAHVDYKDKASGDHWILVYARNGDNTYNAIDPAYGKQMLLTSARNQTVDNARYATTKDEKTGILFGWPRSGGSANQQKYIVVRFGLLT
jgi:hypothetical protein